MSAFLIHATIHIAQAYPLLAQTPLMRAEPGNP